MIQPTYHFSRIHHPLIFAHSLLIGLTPLIPIPFVDDWVKTSFQLRMVRQISAANGVALTGEVIETILQENFWDSCVSGCVLAVFNLLRRIFRKIIFILEIRRGLDLFSQAYYTGFLYEAALLDGFTFGGPTESIEADRRLREAIRRTRYAANFKYIQRLLRTAIRPAALLGAALLLVRNTVVHLPAFLIALPGAFVRSLRQTPRRIQESARTTFRTARGLPRQVGSWWIRAAADFYARVQVLVSGEKLLGSLIIEQMSKALEAALLKLPPGHFDALRAQLAQELKMV